MWIYDKADIDTIKKFMEDDDNINKTKGELVRQLQNWYHNDTAMRSLVNRMMTNARGIDLDYIADEFYSSYRTWNPPRLGLKRSNECRCDIKALASSGHEKGCGFLQWKKEQEELNSLKEDIARQAQEFASGYAHNIMTQQSPGLRSQLSFLPGTLEAKQYKKLKKEIGEQAAKELFAKSDDELRSIIDFYIKKIKGS